jgi:DNA-binding beta-propeller fold protein YncE
VAVLAGSQRALTANHTSNSASLVDLSEGKVLAEVPCGHKPSAVACSRDGRRAAVSNLWSGTLTLLEVNGATLRPAGTASVGAAPRGLVFAPDGASLYVALAGANEVVRIDWPTGKVTRRWPAPTEPRRLALTRDGRYLAAVSGRSAQVRCWDTQTGQLLWERTILEAFNLNGLTFSPDDKELVTALIHDHHHPIALHNIREGWALNNRLGRLTLQPDQRTEYWQIALDIRGQAVGDPCAAAFSAKGDWLVVAAAGTHELLLFQNGAVPWNSGEPGDFLDSHLAIDDSKFRRLPLGGRPLAVQFVGDSEQAVVANYLLDAVQVVDVRTGKLVRQIPLGGPTQPAPARRGEAIFYDAQRSHAAWFSCHTCHPDGHTCGRAFDTLNDDSFGNPKLTPSLRGVSKTGPWTWHGWQKDLGAAVKKSLTDTLFGPTPSPDDVKALVAFLETLDFPPNPHRNADGSLSAAGERGRAIFQGKGRCVRCHQGDYYTSAKNYDVKLESDGSPFELWNPPSLRGVYDRGPYLHDGRAETLEEVLRTDHAPERLGGPVLSPEERSDLIEFLKAL